jgi:uncharacterized YigZ family protein
MNGFSYHTIQKSSTGLYKEKGSKFLSFAFPVQTEDEIRQYLERLKKEYYDARHHCFGWMLGVEQKHFRAFDDGEPNHSAGDPILGQIRSRNLTNVVIFVVRYFGGTKLGVGGLISAYKLSAEEALNNAVIIEKEVTGPLQFNFDYTATPEVMRLIKELNLVVVDQKLDMECSITIEVPLRLKARLFEKIKLLQMTGTNLSVNTW